MLARVTRAIALACAVVAVALAVTVTSVAPHAPSAALDPPVVRLPAAQPAPALRWTRTAPTPTPGAADH
jgi:hypothetical protein